MRLRMNNSDCRCDRCAWCHERIVKEREEEKVKNLFRDDFSKRDRFGKGGAFNYMNFKDCEQGDKFNAKI